MDILPIKLEVYIYTFDYFCKLSEEELMKEKTFNEVYDEIYNLYLDAEKFEYEL